MTVHRKKRRSFSQNAEPGQIVANALSTLDAVLTAAVDGQTQTAGTASLLDPWRGMHLDRLEVQRLLAAGNDRSTLRETAGANGCGAAELLGGAMLALPRVQRTAAGLGLTHVDLAAFLIALAPDLDLRYERIYGYLQDDITRRRPSLDFVANLLGTDARDRLDVIGRFRTDQPLLRFGLLVTGANREVPALARAWRVDDLWRQYFLGEAVQDFSPDECVHFVDPGETIPSLAIADDVAQLLSGGLGLRPGVIRLALHGPHGAGKFTLARTLAHARQQRLLVVDVREMATAAEVRRLMAWTERAALLGDALIYLHGIQRLEARDPQIVRAVCDELAICAANFIISSTLPLSPTHGRPLAITRIELAYPSSEVRCRLWQHELSRHAIDADREDLDGVAVRFSLSGAQIEQAAMELAERASADRRHVAYLQLAAAARAQSGSQLARLAQRILPRAGLDTIIAPADVHAQLHELCARVGTRAVVRDGWAQGSVHARSSGVTALFVGPSGTGKTLSAEAVARELGFDLYRIDLSGIVSKYIGETEKNLDGVFAAAEHANAVLFFDEADALFGKRSEVKDAHDRYANIEIAYLLQKMEQFDGLAILATNLKQNLDEAFARRLTFTVNFPFPEEVERRRLWEQLWPPRAPRAADVDLDWFAREYRMSGGNIRNTVMAAAHLAAADGQVITRDHLVHAARREFQKLGKNLAPAATTGGAAAIAGGAHHGVLNGRMGGVTR